VPPLEQLIKANRRFRHFTRISQMRAQFGGVFSGICVINQLDSDHFGEV
jgi:hypothetical protein